MAARILADIPRADRELLSQRLSGVARTIELLATGLLAAHPALEISSAYDGLAVLQQEILDIANDMGGRT